MHKCALAVVVLAALLAAGDEPKRPDWSLRGKELAEMLAGLAGEQGLDPQDYSTYRSRGCSSSLWGRGDVVTVPVGGKPYVVAVQSVVAISVPGTSAQQVVLVTPEGKILDRIQCHMSSRYGDTATSVSRQPHADGAHVVISFEPSGKGSQWHNWHTISIGGRFHTFWEREKDTPGDWNYRGLCRAEIADGRFAVVFPRLERPDQEFRGARSLRIGYLLDNEVKYLDVADPKQVEAILSAMAVEGTEQGAVGWAPGDATVDLRFACTTTRLTFQTPTFLYRADWGRIHLSSTAFHDKIAEVVAAAEGKAVELVPHPPK